MVIIMGQNGIQMLQCVWLCDLDTPEDFEVSNGMAFTNAYPKLALGTHTDIFEQFLFSQSAPTGQLVTTLIARLASLQDDFSVIFAPEETGLVEPVRLEYVDTQVLLAFLKFIKGVQLVTDMYDAGAVDATYASYLSYLGAPMALWEDHPQLLAIVQSRSAQGVAAKALFEQAVNHYTSVEDALWSRESGATESFLFEIETDIPEELEAALYAEVDPVLRTALEAGIAAALEAERALQRAEFRLSLTQFVQSLNGPVALSDLDETGSAEQSVSLQPLVAASPVNLRAVMPEFDERGVLAASSEDLLAAGFTSGISNLELDQLLADANALYVPAPQSLVGKVLLKRSTAPIGGYQYEFYLFDSDSKLTYLERNGAVSGVYEVRDYLWNSAAGLLEDLTSSGETELELETGATGSYKSYHPGAWSVDRGSFILYDGSRDLDENGQADAEQITAGQVPYYTIYNADPFVRFYDDWDGDGRTNLQEQNEGTDPIDADSYRTPPETTWYAGASYVSDGWRYFGWFKGFKPAGANWIYHGRHGWLYTLGADTSSLFLWDVALGRWMFTNEAAYPWIYAYGPDGGWVFFFEGGRPGSRYFKRGDNGQTLSEQQLRMAP